MTFFVIEMNSCQTILKTFYISTMVWPSGFSRAHTFSSAILHSCILPLACKHEPIHLDCSSYNELSFSIPSNLTNECLLAAKYQMQCGLPLESPCFCRDIPIISRGNNITITPPREGLRCRAKVGLLFWEEKWDAEWWIMILPKPGHLSLAVLWVTLVHFSSVLLWHYHIKWVIPETYSHVCYCDTSW